MLRRLAATVAFASATSLATAAPTLWITDVDNRLGTIDVATGAVLSSIAITGTAGGVTDIAFDAAGRLWAVTAGALYRVDATTGAATPVGTTGLGALNSLAFDASSGLLYGATRDASGLFTLSTATGLATRVGGVANSLLNAAGDLAFFQDVLYMTSADDRLVRIDRNAPGNPFATFALGPLGVSGMLGLAGDASGLYGVSGTSIYRIDTVTGRVLLEAGLPLATFGAPLAGVTGAAFRTDVLAAVPAPASLALLAVALVGLGSARRVRARA